MKKNLLLLLLFVSPIVMIAKERTQSEALSIAEEFFNKSQGINTRASATPTLVAVSSDFNYSPSTRTASTQVPAFYIYNNGTEAFAIVSGDDRMKPILGYSDKGAFVTENIPANIVSFLASYVTEMNWLVTNDAPAKTFYAPATRSYPSAVSPLLGSIMYNQSAPYNDFCPEQDGSTSVTGCVATAMAQVLKYHEYPTTGSGSITYTTSTYNLSCTFNYSDTTFVWADMLDQYVTGEYTSAQANAVASLMYGCGVSVNMDYTSDESGAEPYSIPNALTTYFNYDSNIAYVERAYFTYTEWMDLIKNELSNSRPILYDGVSTEGGHEFVFDGYDENDMVHVNWGWAGQDNGYFVISDLDPSSPGIGGGTNLGGGFTSNQGMNIGIQPPSSTSTYTSYFTCDSISLSSTTVSLGSTFSPTLYMLVNMSSSFTGDIALIFEQNGTQTVISSGSFSQSVPTQEGYQSIAWSNFNSSSTLPTTLADGNYVFYAATKSTAKTESTWSPVRGIMGSNTKYNVVVANSVATFTPYWGTDIQISASVDVLHDLYIDKTGEFTLTYQNNSSSSEYYGTISIALLSEGSIVTLLSSNEVYMTAGQTSTTADVAVTIEDDSDSDSSSSTSTLSAGTYSICAVAQWGDGYVELGTPQSVTLYTYSGTSDISVTSASLASTTIEPTGTLTINAEIEATGTAPVYIDQIAAALFDSGGTTSINVFYKNVYITVGDTYSLSMTITPNLDEGNYFVMLYKPVTSGSSTSEESMSSQLSFTVKGGTGIEDSNEEGGDKVIVYPQPAGEVLYVRAPSDVNMAEIYNVAGQLLKKEYLVGSGTEFSLPISQFASGTYILVLHANDKVYRQKFVK